jgi:ketosteroid isomerase-like protein
MLALTILAISPAFGGAVPQAATPASAADPGAEVLAVDDARNAALQKADVAALQRIYADDYRLIGRNGRVVRKPDQLEAFRSGAARYTSFELVEREVEVIAPTVAVVWSRERAGILVNGQDNGGDLRYTRVYVLRNGQWQLLSAHASANAAQ